MLYLTSDHFAFFLPLGLIGVFRYLWFVIRLLAAWAYKPIPVPLKPTYFPQEDVTIVVPTIDSDAHFLTAMRSWLVGQPFEILIITTFAVLPELERLAAEMNVEDAERNPEMAKRGLLGRDGRGRVKVFGVDKANKRRQMVEGIKRTETDIIVFADDDAIWPPRLLPLVLACFEDLSIGGVGTSQVVAPLRASGKLTVWETLAAFRLSIRNVEIAASTYLDGGVPCLSGRTAAYRSIILKDPAFMTEFTNDYWRGKYHLNSGDDKFLTRWCVLRWTRNTWRSDLRSIFIERHIWTAHPYVAYSMIDKFLNPFTLLAGPALVIFLCARSASNDPINGVYVLPVWNVLLSWCVWLTATRTAKLAPHLWNRPMDFVYVPVWVAFGYYFSVMKLYALCTLHEVGWGTRAGIDTNSPSTSTSAPAYDPSSPPPFPGVLPREQTRQVDEAVLDPTMAQRFHSSAFSDRSSSPNPLPTSSPTSTYPASPPASGSAPHFPLALSAPSLASIDPAGVPYPAHELDTPSPTLAPLDVDYGGPATFSPPPMLRIHHLDEDPTRLEPLLHSTQAMAHDSVSGEEGASTSDGVRDHWKEWERATKEAMDQFELDRQRASPQDGIDYAGSRARTLENDREGEIVFGGPGHPASPTTDREGGPPGDTIRLVS
ncbi:hypothetical protein JCM10212_003784 [Sporobolomyces blumeae]